MDGGCEGVERQKKGDEHYHRLANSLTSNHQRANLGGDPLYCVKVSLRGYWESGFENIHSEARELLGNLDLFADCEGDSWRLQQGQENISALLVRRSSPSVRRFGVAGSVC